MAGRLWRLIKRQTGDDCGEMICQEHLSPRPGGYRLVVLSDDAKDFMKRCDAGEAVEPTTFMLEPYVVLERVPFNLHTADGKIHVDRVNGRTAKSILEGNQDDLDFYKQVYIRDNVTKVTHEDTVIWQR